MLSIGDEFTYNVFQVLDETFVASALILSFYFVEFNKNLYSILNDGRSWMFVHWPPPSFKALFSRWVDAPITFSCYA